jgi:hypothetical protein
MQQDLAEGRKMGCMGMGYDFMIRSIIRAKDLDASFYRSHFANLQLPNCVPIVSNANEPCNAKVAPSLRQ